MNLTALSFSFQFIHSFIPLHASTERRGEKETALSERTVIENFFPSRRHLCSWWIRRRRRRRVYGREKGELIHRLFYSYPNCSSSDLPTAERASVTRTFGENEQLNYACSVLLEFSFFNHHTALFEFGIIDGFPSKGR